MSYKFGSYAQSPLYPDIILFFLKKALKHCRYHKGQKKGKKCSQQGGQKGHTLAEQREMV